MMTITAAKLQVNKELGVAISEFPITIDVARQAQQLGLATVVGAPNILLGGSHTGNLSAAEAVKEGCADILCFRLLSCGNAAQYFHYA